MPDANGAWIEPALAFSARLAEVAKGEQPRFFAEQSLVFGITVQTLRRNTLAARYCASHAKGVGLAVKDVVAAALTVEMLIRLERRDRAAANKIRKAVFEGRVSAREMQERLRAVPERKPRGRRMSEWTSFALGIIEMCYTEAPQSFAKAEHSEIGKLLKVDIEVWLKGAKVPDAIFLSPLDDYSECAGLTFEDQVPFILAACVMYPRVNLALHERSEADRIFEVLDKARRKLPATPRLFRLYGDDDDDLDVAVRAVSE